MALKTRIFVYEYLSGGGDLAGGLADELPAMGQAMRDAMVADLLAVENCQVTVATCAQAAPVPQAARAVSPLRGETAAQFVRRQAEVHDIAWVVAPETDGLLAALHPCVGAERWLGCDLPAIELSTHKRRTLSALARHGIATPLDFEQAPDIDRWVVKPDDGAGSVATRVHRSRQHACEDWRGRKCAGQSAAMEPWIDGAALSLSLMCGAAGCELLSINRQQLHVDEEGWVSFCGVEAGAISLGDPRAARLAELATRIHGAIDGLRGFVGIDLVWHAARGPVVIEVNPRVTCAYVGLSRVLGRNLAADVIASHAAHPILELAHGHA